MGIYIVVFCFIVSYKAKSSAMDATRADMNIVAFGDPRSRGHIARRYAISQVTEAPRFFING